MTDGAPAPPRSTVDDDVTALVLAARAGDGQAWCALVDRFGRLVYAVAVRCRLSPADAADVSQTVWLRLAEHLHRIHDPARVGAWLVTTTRRESVALIKARARFEPMDVQEFDIADDRQGPAEQVTRLETITEVAAAFALLTERCRELLRRLVVDAQNYQEISAAMAMPVGSIGPTRIRCLAHLRRHLEEAADAP